MNPIYNDDRAEDYSWRLYRGATPQEPVDDMFSFFPCRVASDDSLGFPRPTIRLPEVINPRHKQSYKLLSEEEADSRGFSRLWRQVREQVIEAECKLGIHAALPTTTVRREESERIEEAASCS